MDKVDTSLCVHQILATSKHRFSLVEGSRDAVRALANHIEQLQITHQWYGKGHIFLLIDARSAVGLPIRYLFEVLSDYNRSYEDLEAPKLTLAYLRSPDTVILDVYHMMAELFDPPLSVQFFIEEAHAERWLMEKQ
ncbi:MAG: hypothetical protein WBC91_12990 [Phototrophicaceae bacterium]